MERELLSASHSPGIAPGSGGRNGGVVRGFAAGREGKGREGAGNRCQLKPKNDLAVFTEKGRKQEGSAWMNIS